MNLETVAIHAGRKSDSASGAVVDPIHMSVAFERDPDGNHSRGYFYSIAGNPSREAMEECINVLEGGATAISFSSGSAAIGAVLRTLRPGDHVVVPQDVFQGTIRILKEILFEWGISHTVADFTSLAAVQDAFRANTKLLWAETLSNPLLKMSDVGQLATLAHARGALLVVDNTFITPVFQRPLTLGADFVVHASTKYLGGHGDVVGGIVVARDRGSHTDRLRALQRTEGAVPSPFDCWLTLRGIKTLPYRMRAHAHNALKVAGSLVGHPMVEAVHYPGIPSHPHHQLARATLDGYGGVVSFQVHGGRETALRVAANVKLFTHATSLGQADSLIQHQASSPTHGPHTGLAENLLRLSVGLEHPADLIMDLRDALALSGGDHDANGGS